MISEAARLEALGEPEVRFRWRNRELVIPRALEDWPLDHLQAGEYVDAVTVLLGGQTAPIPLYSDLMSLSEAMATAVGVQRLPEYVPPRERNGSIDVFGAVPMLLGLIAQYEDDIASDLRRFWNVDYLDRWRGGLTLRQIWTYIRRSQPTSALAIARNGGNELWTKQSIVLAQVWEQLSRQVYVGRPMTTEEVNAALARHRANAETMDGLAAKQDYYSPEATKARLDAARAKKRAPAMPGGLPEPPSTAVSALDKAMASRRRDMTRKAG